MLGEVHLKNLTNFNLQIFTNFYKFYKLQIFMKFFLPIPPITVIGGGQSPSNFSRSSNQDRRGQSDGRVEGKQSWESWVLRHFSKSGTSRYAGGSPPIKEIKKVINLIIISTYQIISTS